MKSTFTMKISPILLTLALAWGTGGAAISMALAQSDDLNARKSQDRDQDDRVQTYNRVQDERKDEHASPQVPQTPYRGARAIYDDPERPPQPVDAPPAVFRYPSDKPGLTLQSPRTRPFVPLD